MTIDNAYTQRRNEVCAITGLTQSQYLWCAIRKSKAYLTANGYPLALHKNNAFTGWWLRQWYVRDGLYLTAIYHYADQLFDLWHKDNELAASLPNGPIGELYTAMPAGVTTDSLKAWLSDVFEPSEFRPSHEQHPLYLPPCVLQD